MMENLNSIPPTFLDLIFSIAGCLSKVSSLKLARRVEEEWLQTQAMHEKNLFFAFLIPGSLQIKLAVSSLNSRSPVTFKGAFVADSLRPLRTWLGWKVDSGWKKGYPYCDNINNLATWQSPFMSFTELLQTGCSFVSMFLFWA